VAVHHRTARWLDRLPDPVRHHAIVAQPASLTRIEHVREKVVAPRVHQHPDEPIGALRHPPDGERARLGIGASMRCTNDSSAPASSCNEGAGGERVAAALAE
jgi:hypothetical protein